MRILILLGVAIIGALPMRPVSAQQPDLAAPPSEHAALSAFLAGYLGPVAVRENGRITSTIERVMNGKPVFRAALGAVSAQAVGADELWPGGASGLGLSGFGVTFGLWEYGGWPAAAHEEFADDGGATRVRVLGVHHDFSDVSGHATGVAGRAAATGANPQLRGPAFRSLIDAYDDSLDTAELAAAAAAGLRVSNHAYGDQNGWRGTGKSAFDGVHRLRVWLGDPDISATEDYKFGFYDDRSAAWDGLVAAHPDLTIVISAGNDRVQDAPADTDSHWVYTGAPPLDAPPYGWSISTTLRDDDGGPSGYDTVIGGMQTMKNGLTVGAVHNLEACPGVTDPPPPLGMTDFSAWGPTDDGRIKPDLVAPGSQQWTPWADTGGGCVTGGGTSSSAPVVSGGVAMLIEYADRLGAAFPASAVRALLLHTARDLGPVGPDYQHGWGLPDFERAAALLGAAPTGSEALRLDTLVSGTVDSLALFSTGTDTLKLTLAWTDPAAPAQTTEPPGTWLDNPERRLVNDLDLRVVGPNAGLFEPWALDPVNPDALAQAGDNDRDNVEQVVVALPDTGRHVVRISSKSALTGSAQAYAVAVSGATSCGAVVDVAAGWNLISAPCAEADMSLSALLPEAQSQAYGYGASGYVGVATLQPGRGYWVLFDAPHRYVLAGGEAPGEIPVRDGWNLIGPFGRAVGADEITGVGAEIVSSFYGYGAVGYVGVETMQPGRGYWVLIEGEGTLVVPD